MKPMLPWWSCSALILDGEDEIEADLDVRAATAGEAEDIARAEWADLGLGADAVTVRRCEEKCEIVPAVAASSRECGGIRQSDCRHDWVESGFAGHSHWCQRCLLPGRRAGR